MSNYWSRKLAVIFLLLGTLTAGFAQPKINSPYSRIGLGDLVNPSFSHARGMGSLGAAYNDPYHMNIVNPASYSFLYSAAFDVGINTRRSQLSNNGSSETVWSGNLEYISLGFPTKNSINRAANPIKSPWYWGMNFTFIPYSNVGYKIESVSATTAADTVAFNFEGNGGTFKFLWGNAVRYKNLSLGLNFGYLFGKVSTTQEVFFNNLENSYQNEISEAFSPAGIIWNLGVQYAHPFMKINKKGELRPDGRRLTFGAYGNSGNNINFNTSETFIRFNPTYTLGGGSGIDTIRQTTDNILKGKLPAEFGIGVYYTKNNEKGIGIDYKTTRWSDYVNPIRPTEQLENSWRLAIGANITPNSRSIRSYWSKINYQAGLFYGKDPRSGKDAQGFDKTLTDKGITFGMGLPVIMKNQTSFVNFAFELGQFKAKDGLKENYGKVTVGFTLNNNEWFLKRKFY